MRTVDEIRADLTKVAGEFDADIARQEKMRDDARDQAKAHSKEAGVLKRRCAAALKTLHAELGAVVAGS